tara:strand:+ start:4859 stop:5254 length:396 start_codon:yes stop_codon:yes gene_type:complete
VIGIIGSILGPLIGGVRDYVSTGQEIKKAESANKARLLLDSQSNNSEWEMASLTDKDRWLRRGSFSMFAAPFFWALYDPAGVEQYFTIALAAMPDWYVQIFCSMVGGVWGISALKNTAPALVGGILKAIKK